MSKRSLKGLLLEMKMSESYEMRVLAEETIVIMFEEERAKSQKLAMALTNLLECIDKKQLEVFPHNVSMAKEYLAEYIKEYKGGE